VSRAAAIAFACAASLPLAGAAQPSDSSLPDGTYRYVVIDSGKSEATSLIRVSRSHGNLAIEEHASPMEDDEWSRRMLDPTTFATRSYSDNFDGKPAFTVTIDGSTAILAQGTATTKITALPGAPFLVFDYFVAPFFALPASLSGAATSTFSILVAGAEKAELLVTSAGVAKRPAGIAMADSSIAVTIGNSVGTLWYNPQTLVLDELDLPEARIVYKRVSTEP
jgi:hypothetical protein